MPMGEKRIWMPLLAQPAAEPADSRVGQDECDADDDGRDRDRDVEGHLQRATPEELAFGEDQRRADADDGVDRHGDEGHLAGELQGGEGVGLGHLDPERVEAVAEGLDEEIADGEPHEETEVEDDDEAQRPLSRGVVHGASLRWMRRAKTFVAMRINRLSTNSAVETAAAFVQRKPCVKL